MFSTVSQIMMNMFNKKLNDGFPKGKIVLVSLHNILPPPKGTDGYTHKNIAGLNNVVDSTTSEQD